MPVLTHGGLQSNETAPCRRGLRECLPDACLNFAQQKLRLSNQLLAGYSAGYPQSSPQNPWVSVQRIALIVLWPVASAMKSSCEDLVPTHCHAFFFFSRRTIVDWLVRKCLAAARVLP